MSKNNIDNSNLELDNKYEVVVHEIHIDEIDSDFIKGESYATINADNISYDVTIVNVSDKIDLGNEKKGISLTLSIDNAITKMDFIKFLSADFSNAYIIVSPNEKQDIIADFTLSALYTDNYFQLVDRGDVNTEFDVVDNSSK